MDMMDKKKSHIPTLAVESDDFRDANRHNQYPLYFVSKAEMVNISFKHG